MNNEPIAWMCKDDDVITDKFKQSGKGGDCSEYDIPLYTTPQIKELSDEEIVTLLKVAEILLKRFGDLTDESIAILKKASEK